MLLDERQELGIDRSGPIRLRITERGNNVVVYARWQVRQRIALQAFLGRAYGLKEIVDYETEPRLARIGRAGPFHVKTAWRFVDVIAGLSDSLDRYGAGNARP